VDGLIGLVHQYDARGEVAADERVPDVAVARRGREVAIRDSLSAAVRFRDLTLR